MIGTALKRCLLFLFLLCIWSFPLYTPVYYEQNFQTIEKKAEVKSSNNSLSVAPPANSGQSTTTSTASSHTKSVKLASRRASYTPVRASTTISVGRLKTYLEERGSPLAPYAEQILASPHWSLIIGICTIEQYGCTKAPGFNYWGIAKSGGGYARYQTMEEGINAITNLLAKYETQGKDTVEKLNGYYVVPASSNWYNTVTKTKIKLESLE